MKEVCLVWEMGGEYDTRYENVILIFETLKEGEAAVAAIEKEMKALAKIAEPSARFNYEWEAWARGYPDAVKYTAEARAPLWQRFSDEYNAEVRAILKVYPCETKLPDGRVVFGMPDLRERPDFSAVMMPINKLADLQKTG